MLSISGCQRRIMSTWQTTPSYKLLRTEGPDHARRFTVQERMGLAVIYGDIGTGKTTIINGIIRILDFETLGTGAPLADALGSGMGRAGGYSDGRDIGVVFNYPNPGGAHALPMCGGVGAQYAPAAGWAQAVTYNATPVIAATRSGENRGRTSRSSRSSPRASRCSAIPTSPTWVPSSRYCIAIRQSAMFFLSTGERVPLVTTPTWCRPTWTQSP